MWHGAGNRVVALYDEGRSVAFKKFGTSTFEVDLS